jgi:hypothetical protein
MLPNNQVRERLRPKVVASVALDGAGLAEFARKTGQVTQATTHIRTHHVETVGAHCRLQPHDSLRACVRAGGGGRRQPVLHRCRTDRIRSDRCRTRRLLVSRLACRERCCVGVSLLTSLAGRGWVAAMSIRTHMRQALNERDLPSIASEPGVFILESVRID